ncbi:hypothetical protein CQA18_26150, partial [Enterobacter hormaechei]
LQRDNVRKAKETASQLLEHVEGLRKQPKGADWIYSRIERLRNRGVIGEAAANEIRKTSLQRDNVRKAKETASQLLEHVEGLRKQPKGADWI